MTREEQIKQAAAEYAENRAYPSEQAFVAGAEWADQHQPSPWISVEERLPKHDERVLFAMQDGEYLQVAFGMLYLGKIEIWNSDIRPTHWMPIPPIEKGGEK